MLLAMDNSDLRTIDSLFEGEPVELTDEYWEELMKKAFSDERLDEPFGLGVPPEWTGRTRRELREFLRRVRS